MTARESFVRSDTAGPLDSLEALMKKREDLAKAITAQVVTTNIRVPTIKISDENRNTNTNMSFYALEVF